MEISTKLKNAFVWFFRFQFNNTSTMKLIRCILVLLSINPFSSAYNPRILDYALQVIEHLASGRGGIFECVFFDMSPQYPFETIMTKLLVSPRL